MTGTGCDHEHTEAINIAAGWLAEHWQEAVEHPLVAVLRERFGLSLWDSMRAIAQAKRIREAGRG